MPPLYPDHRLSPLSVSPTLAIPRPSLWRCPFPFKPIVSARAWISLTNDVAFVARCLAEMPSRITFLGRTYHGPHASVNWRYRTFALPGHLLPPLLPCEITIACICLLFRVTVGDTGLGLER